MRQFEFEYVNEGLFRKNLRKLDAWKKSNIVSNIVFHIFTEKLNKDRIATICKVISEEIPNANYIGCSTNGNIYRGGFTKKDTVICTLFEYATTKVDILQYKLTNETEKEVTENLMDYIKNNPWVKAIEFVTTIRGMSMTNLCRDLSKLPENIEVFGGGAFCEDLNNNSAYVFSNKNECTDNSIAFLLIGGEDFYISTSFIAGWKPLGRELHVTKANGPELIELDNKPAYETYYRYLKINNDNNFFKNTLEFPFLYNHNGINILRAPIASTENGTLIMTSDIEENVKAKIAYGDPWTILNGIEQEAKKYAEFTPETISVFSCAARRTFWGDKEVKKELKPFGHLAPIYGFYTSSEFQRTNNEVIQHNVTLAVAAMREGDPIVNKQINTDIEDNVDIQGETSMINRLANFIQASTEELEDAIYQLGKMAISDGMTGLLNRKEIQKRITEMVKNNQSSHISLIMMDIDDFKHVNDTYGHAEGDNVLVALANMIKSNIAEHAPNYMAGRWGGEEFMILCPDTTLEDAITVAEFIRKDFANLVFEKANKCTMSLGVAEAQIGENPDVTCMRVDNAMYKSKTTGKNKVSF